MTLIDVYHKRARIPGEDDLYVVAILNPVSRVKKDQYWFAETETDAVLEYRDCEMHDADDEKPTVPPKEILRELLEDTGADMVINANGETIAEFTVYQY